MATQLVLIESTEHDWKLDEATRESGRRGVAAARQALREASERRQKRSSDRTAA
jgi:hypothetical protein